MRNRKERRCWISWSDTVRRCCSSTGFNAQGHPSEATVAAVATGADGRLEAARVEQHLYAKRQSTVEPVFGLIQQVMGFWHLLLRGLPAVQGEWNWVCIAYHLKRLQVVHGVTG